MPADYTSQAQLQAAFDAVTLTLWTNEITGDTLTVSGKTKAVWGSHPTTGAPFILEPVPADFIPHDAYADIESDIAALEAVVASLDVSHQGNYTATTTELALAALQAAVLTPEANWTATLTATAEPQSVKQAIVSEGSWIVGVDGSETAGSIKSKLLSNADTQLLTDAQLATVVSTPANFAAAANARVSLQAAIEGKEPAFTKNTAFNRSFGATVGTVAQGNDARFLSTEQLAIVNSTPSNFVNANDRIDGLESLINSIGEPAVVYPPPTALTLLQSGSTVTATWNENGGPDHRRYGAYLSTTPHGDTDEGKSNDLGFSDNSLDGSTHTFIDLPIGTYTVYARLEWSDDLFEDAQTTVAELRYLDASLAVDVEAPVVTPPVLSCSATSATFVINDGNPVAYGGGPYEVKMDWTDDQGNYSGGPPVTGLQASVGVIAYVTQEGAHPTNVYSWTLPSTGSAVDVNFTYGENPAKDPSVQCTATAVISIPASGGSGFVPPPTGIQPTSSLQGFGTESTFARDLVNGAAVVPVTNFNQSGAGSLRGALQERSDRRYIIPLVSGTLTANDTMYCAGRFALLGAAAKFAVRTLPGNGYVTFLLNAPHQLVRHMTLMSGQASFAGEQARKPIQSYSHTHVVDHCTLLFGVDDVAAVYGLSKSDNTTWSYNMMAFGLLRSHQGTYNSGKIMIIGSGDCSFHHNLLYSGYYRAPQISNEFTDSRNNVSLAAGAILIAEVHAEHNVYANAVNNIDLSGNTIDQQACRHGVYVTSPSTPKIRKAYGYLSGNVNAAGNPLPVTYNRGDANAMNYNVILNSPVTLSPQTGRSVPAVTTHSTAELEAHLYPQAGAYLAGRSDVENDVISRMQNRTVAYYDAVAGDSLYPQTFAGDSAVYARKYPKWPTIPVTGINPAFDVTQIDCVPAAWKVSKGLASNADTTKIDLNGDGIPAFEVFYEEVTGCPPF